MADWQTAWLSSRDNPLLFVTDVMGVKDLYPWQREGLIAIGEACKAADPMATVAEVIRLAVKAGHSVGKTAWESWIAIWGVSTRKPIKVQITANSEDQIKDTIWPEIGLWLDKLPPELRAMFDKNSERICVKGAEDLSFITWRVVNKANPEAVQGLHSDHVILIVDEASGIADSYFNAVIGSLSAKRFALMVVAGNPTQPTGFFHDIFTKMRALWRCFTVSSEDVPSARGHIQMVFDRHGRDSNEYRIRVLGEFPESTDDAVIPLFLLEAAIKRDVKPILSLAPVWGVDVARFGDDATALAKRRANCLLEPVKIKRGYDTMQTVGWIRDEWGETAYDERPSEILVDVIGIGAGVVDRLRELGLPVRGINVAESASSKDRYNRLRDELWFKGKEWLEAKDCRIPNDPALIAELTGPKYKILPNGRIKVDSKEEMKEDGMQSPDRADAFLLTLMGGFHKANVNDGKQRYRKPQRGKVRSWQAA